MIIEGGSRRGAKWFAGHLMRQDGGQLVRLAEVRGLAGYDIPSWFRQMEAVSFGTRCENYFYHANINPREDERLTEAQWGEAIDKLEQELGLDGHARFVVEHEKQGRVHRHVFWSRIDPDTMTAVSDSKNYEIHSRTADELEQLFGHERTPRGHEVAERNPHNWEVFRGKRYGFSPYGVGVEMTELWRTTDTGRALAAAIDEHGYILAEGDHGLCVIDPVGKERSLSRRINGARKKDVDARMADMDRSALPTVDEARDMARQRAVQRKDSEQQPTGFKPDAQASPAQSSAKKHGPSPFGELAEELLHTVKNGMKGKESELAAQAAEATPFERLAQTLAHSAKETGPLAGELAIAVAVVEGEHVAKEMLRGKEAPARSLTQAISPAPELSPFEQVTRDIKQVIHRTRSDDELVTAGLDWVRQKISSNRPTSPVAGDRTPFERVTENTKQALRANGGQPQTNDEESFWQRARTLIAAAHERAASWAREAWEGFVDRFKRGRDGARDDQGFER